MDPVHRPDHPLVDTMPSASTSACFDKAVIIRPRAPPPGRQARLPWAGGWSPLPLMRQPSPQGDELSIGGESPPKREPTKKVARWHIPYGGAFRPRHLAYPDGGVIRPRYSNTLVFNVKNRGDITPREREPAMATTCNWRNLRGARGTVHI